MQNYKIDWMERKTTSTNKEKIDATLTGADGSKHEKVTIWADFPDFANLAPGSTIEAEIVEKQNGQYTNKTAYAPKVKKGNGGAFKTMQIEKAQDKKREDISHAQENKAHNVKVASTFRDATLLAIAEFQEQRRLSTTGETLEQLFKKWREFCWMNYDVDESKEFAPF